MCRCIWFCAILTASLASASPSRGPLPLRFDFQQSQDEALKSEFYYNLKDEGKELILGKYRINAESVFAEQTGPRAVKFVWPAIFGSRGQIDVISFTGEVIAQRQFGPRDVEKEEKLNTLPMVDSTRRILRPGSPRRFCLVAEAAKGRSQVCSPYLIYRPQKGFVPLKIAEANPRVVLNKQVAPPEQSIFIKTGDSLRFFCELSTAVTIEIIDIVQPLEISEVTKIGDSEEFAVIGQGEKPLGKSEDITPPFFNKFEQFIRWEDTIGDFRKYWKQVLSNGETYVYFRGGGNGVYRLKIERDTVPPDALRPTLNASTVNTTYSSSIKLFGSRTPKSMLKTTQIKVKTVKNSEDFTWYFEAKDRGQLNKSYLNVVGDDGKSYPTSFEVYRGYNGEISGRLAGLMHDTKQVIVGELNLTYWFEDILGWSEYYISRQRWGLSAKILRSFGKFSTGSESETILENDFFDLKYRFAPGIWERDETVGLIGSLQRYKFGAFNYTAYGAGIFWAKSMPKIFDDFMNILPVFRYPKWVDMDYIYYPAPVGNTYKFRGPNFSLDFHGKVLWTKRFFGEAGFGYKNYGLDSPKDKRSNVFGSAYATFGIGLNY